jgi:hypothetical protein
MSSPLLLVGREAVAPCVTHRATVVVRATLTVAGGVPVTVALL